MISNLGKKGFYLLDMSNVRRTVIARLGDDILAVELRKGTAETLSRRGGCLAHRVVGGWVEERFVAGSPA